jgi:MOSC domain-containing protein YiiM
MATGTLVSVNVGRPHPYAWRGRTISSGIWKHPVSGPVAVRGTNLVGDEQADLRAHGGPDKAIYAYSTEDYAWWSTQLGRALEPASFGENLTTAGLDLTSSLIGDRWQVGTALLEVAQPRTPCYKLGIRMDDDTFPDRFLEEGRTGAYLRIIHEGELAAGDPIVVIPSRAERLSLGDVARSCWRSPSWLPPGTPGPEGPWSAILWQHQPILTQDRARSSLEGLVLKAWASEPCPTTPPAPSPRVRTRSP